MVECGCDGDRVVCTPKSEAEKALELRHFPDCIAGCECNPDNQIANETESAANILMI